MEGEHFQTVEKLIELQNSLNVNTDQLTTSFEARVRYELSDDRVKRLGHSLAEANFRIEALAAERLAGPSAIEVELESCRVLPGAVNLPEVALRERPDQLRILHIHHNVPGVLSRPHGHAGTL